MKLTSTYPFSFPHSIILGDGLRHFCITLESSAGQLNNRTGVIIDHKDLRELILDWKEEKFGKVESIYEVGNLEYLPHSPEIVTERMWEWIEDILPFSAKLVGLKVVTTSGYFVQYTREEPILVREPQTQTQPKPKFRKRRKKRGRRKENSKDSDRSN